jgi:FkbM family methyltransferase
LVGVYVGGSPKTNQMNPKFKAFFRGLLPKSIRTHHIWAGPLRGHSIVTSWRDYPAAILGFTERPLLNWLAANVKPGETWLDIGAHYGYTAIALSRGVGASGRVFAFEPMLSTAGYLAQTRALNRFSQLTVVPFALAAPDALTTARLPVVRGMVDSTIGKNDTWHETILVARLDWLWQQICDGKTRVHGVKIDVQGMEIEVLRGLTGLLVLNKPKLVVEVHAGVDRGCLLDLIERAGYARRGTPIEPVGGEVEPRYVDDHSYAFTPIPSS